jgi:hypothetical protein
MTLAVAGGGHIAVLRRLRYLGQCVRELVAHDPFSRDLPQPVLRFWRDLAVELRATLSVDVFSLATPLGDLVAAIITYARCGGGGEER